MFNATAVWHMGDSQLKCRTKLAVCFMFAKRILSRIMAAIEAADRAVVVAVLAVVASTINGCTNSAIK